MTLGREDLLRKTKRYNPYLRFRRYRQRFKRKIRKAYEMRHNPTPAEARAWVLIKYRVNPKTVVYRQYVHGGYILDFFHPASNLAIEIDGNIHNPWQDRKRDRHLRRLGVTVIRFPNETIFENPNLFVQEVKRMMELET